MKTEPTQEHLWLKKLLGEWSLQSMEAAMNPSDTSGQSAQQVEPGKWIESIRTMGDLWVVAEGSGEMPGCGAATTLMTLGYDPRRERYVGTWQGSMMDHLW